ncbi:MAG TPA: TIGR02186 family protein [Caulobacterales bacterium]|nr:TIGR02186 family protein [Caulobacterales bacterium]
MRRIVLPVLAVLALLTGSAVAQAPAPPAAGELPAAVAQDQITVNSDYRGSVIDVWGVNTDRRGRGDIVVAVRGPSEPASVMRKRRFLGLWVNGEPVRFSAAPSFFAVLSNRNLREIASPQEIWALQLDPAASARLAGATPPGTAPSDYRAALVRLRTRQDLYQEIPGYRREDNVGLRLYTGGLFRARVALPANAPIADYKVDTYLFRFGHLVSAQHITVKIERIGVERRIHDLATHASLLYGFLTVLLALGAGYVSAYLFRRG